MSERLIGFVKKHNYISLLILLVASVILGYLLLVISYLFPADRIRENIIKDYISVVSVGEWMPGHDDTVPDYYTDSIMLLEAEYDSGDSAFITAVKSPRALLPGADYVYETYLRYNEVNELVFYEYDYYRYWHGYLIFLKPLLFFFSLGTVKYLTVLLQFTLLFVFLFLVIRNGYSFRYAVPMIAAYMYMNPITIGLSFQFSTVYSITLFALIVLFADRQKRKIFEVFPIFYFFVTGVVTSYFDLLTYPVLTFGIPAVYYYLLYAKNDKKDYLSYVLSFISWASGFGGMWLGKWLISLAVFGREVITDVSNSISVRSGFDASETFSGNYVSYFDVLYKNISVQVVYGVLIVALVVCLILFRILKKGFESFKNARTELIICLATALFPFVWYFLLPNHSWIHYWFTYRTLAVSVCSFIMISLAGTDRVRS